MDKKKEEVYQYIYTKTKKQMQSSYQDIGCDAWNISLDLHMDRSNISRLLNQLHKDGRVIKTQGRPTLFICRSLLENKHKASYIPSIIPKGKQITDYLDTEKSPDQHPYKSDCFREYNANRSSSSMFEPIQQAKSALLYPPSGLNILLYGDPCVGKLKFSKVLFQFGLEHGIFLHSAKFIVFDCMDYTTKSAEETLGILFGFFDGEHLKKGMLEQAKHGILVLNHLSQLPLSVLTPIHNAIIHQTYTPLNIINKEIPVRCLIIGNSDSEHMIKNPDIRRCFPMQIRIPALSDKSIQEMLVITMQYFQEESYHIDKTIRISKGALSCFVMSNYSGNLPHLHAEIKQSCAHAFRNFLEHDALFVNIDYDDISTFVLTDIFNINERINELDNILNLFESEYFFFTPLQQNRQLELLYDLDSNTSRNESYLNHIEDKLFNLCIHDINAAISIHLNTIRSIMLKQIYDTVYPILQSCSICSNENLLYGLLLHISNSINKIKSGIQDSTFKSSNYKIAKEEDYGYAHQLMNSIQDSYDITLPSEEIDYIATYLYLSSQWIDNKYIQLLIISENNTAKDYADYLNSQNYKSNISWLKIDSHLSDKQNSALILEKMREINKDKGVVIATDSSLLYGYETLLRNQSGIEFVMVPHASVKNLIPLVEKIESLGVTIHTMKYFNHDDTDETQLDNTKGTQVQDLLHNISEKVLSESLVFLNPKKVCQSLYNVLMNILHDLHISYSDDLLIKFIFHSAFSIERCIRKEPLIYTKARTIINQHDQVYYIVEKNFEIISEIFNVTLSSSEMAMIMEIFLAYLEDNK